MIIKNANVFTEAGVFVKKDIFIDQGKFVDDAPQGSDGSLDGQEVIDGNGCYAIPGLTDIHFHGCVGYDFCDGTFEAMEHMAAYELSVGVTTIVPATMTLARETLYDICKTAAEYVKKNQDTNEKRAILCGINMEGPFVAESKKGAQNAAYIKEPDCAMYDELQSVSGNMIKLVAIAPEINGAMEFIADRKDQVVLSLAHTDADYDTAKEAFDKGASHVTHLYNAMNPYTHRAPGVVAAAAEAGAEVELICDGVHIHPAAVRTTFKIFGDDKIIFVSDSMMATGMEDGDYSLGGQAVKVTGNRATLADGTIAGSATNLMDCMRTAVLKMGIPLESAVKCAAVNSAKSVGIYDQYGSIEPGKVANLVLLKPDDLAIEKIILKGNVV